MSRRRCFGSFSRQRCSRRRTLAGVACGSAVQSGSRSRMAATRSETVSPAKREAARQHFVQDAPERPDVRTLVDGLPACLLGAHVRGGAEDDAVPRAAERSPSATASTSIRSRRLSAALASPKSSTFTSPSGVSVMLPVSDLDGRCPAHAPHQAHPRSVARSRGPQQSAGRRGAALRCDRRERVAFDQFQHERADAVRFFQTVDRPDVRDDSATRGPAPPARIERGVQDRGRTTLGRTLIATSRSSFVSRAR